MIKEPYPIKEYIPKIPEITGVKYDEDKLDYTLIPKSIEEVVKVLMYGAKKYPEPDNWKRVSGGRKRYVRAALRHLMKEVNEDELDESGLLHLAHAACSCIFAIHFAITEDKT